MEDVVDAWKRHINAVIREADRELSLCRYMGWDAKLVIRWRNFLLKELRRIRSKELDRS